jgi:hypothetical protein
MRCSLLGGTEAVGVGITSKSGAQAPQGFTFAHDFDSQIVRLHV